MAVTEKTLRPSVAQGLDQRYTLLDMVDIITLDIFMIKTILMIMMEKLDKGLNQKYTLLDMVDIITS